MSSFTQNLPAADQHPGNISVLVATTQAEDMTSLRHILHHRGWNLSSCSTASEAAEKASEIRPAILICERELPDGSWRDVLQRVEATGNPPLLLVVSRYADESLWAEVLNLGGYDVLLKPFDRAEVTRVVGMAWRQWISLCKQHPRGPEPPPQSSRHYV
jgi:DNA-binding response OmpR family regulator